jgi:hypothetical protein
MTWANRRSKFGAKPVVVDGIRFMSKLEAKRHGQLKLLQEAGEIKWVVHQPRFPLVAGITYIADFKICWADGRVTVEDVKGVETDVFKIKHKLFNHFYSGEFGPLVVLTKKDLGRTT